MDNKYFNSSNSTTGGKPKFMPPQKRVQMETVEEQPQQPKPEVQKFKVDYKSTNDESKSQNSNKSLFKRNCATYTTSWGYRHLRNGYIDKEAEKEDADLFEEQKKKEPLPSEALETYDDLKVEIVNKSNSSVPDAEEKFENLKLSPHLAENIKRCGYERLTIIQRNAIPIMLKQINVMASSQTGSGKTASFLIPIIQKLLEEGPPKNDVSNDEYKKYRKSYPLALVLAPTRELALQIQDESRKFCYMTGLKSKVCYGGTPPYIQQRQLQWDGCDVLVATPGRLIDFMEHLVSLEFVQYIVLDEADRMLDMGFEPQIREILQGVFKQNKNQEDIHVSMYSATFPKNVKILAEQYLSNYVYIGIGSSGKTGSVNKCIKQELIDVRGQMKTLALFNLIKSLDGKLLIFCEQKKTVSSVHTYLSSKNLFVAQIHGGRDQKEREEELKLFKDKCSILIATDVAARGLDISDVTHVINYDLPKNIEGYIHRIGRTGRIGKQGTSISFIDEDDEAMFLKLYNLLRDSEQQIPDWFKDEVDAKLEELHGKGGYRSGSNNGYRGRGGGYRGSRGGGRGSGKYNNLNYNTSYHNGNRFGNKDRVYEGEDGFGYN